MDLVKEAKKMERGAAPGARKRELDLFLQLPTKITIRVHHLAPTRWA